MRLVLFFLGGVFLGSVVGFWAAVIALMAAAFLYFFDKTKLALFSLTMLLGWGYLHLYNFYQKDPEIIFHQKQKLQAVVTKISYNRGRQELLTDRRLKIITLYYPTYEYGDLIEVEGIAKPRITAQADGVIYWPKITPLHKNRGWLIKAKLLSVRDYFQSSFKKLLPYEPAALLAGITFGGRSDFSQELREKMQRSGVSHIVAVSGYNISIILKYLLWLGIIPAALIILAFVIMAGAEASIVRAAIMGLILLLAQGSERTYETMLALLTAAFLMTLTNPRILVFDLGFQLSFLAVLGLVYLEPILRRRLWFVQWLGGQYFWTTLAAQAAVAPLLLYRFGGFSLSGIPANVLILPIVPATMFLGFMTGVFSLFSNTLSQILAWLAGVFLNYELWVIEVFSMAGYLQF